MVTAHQISNQLEGKRNKRVHDAKGRFVSNDAANLVHYTKNVKLFGQAWDKAIKQADAKKLNAIANSMKQFSEVEQAAKQIKEVKTALQQVTAAMEEDKKKGITDPTKLQKIAKLSSELEELTKHAAEVGHAFDKAHATGLKKFTQGIKDALGTNFGQFASWGASIGFLGNALYQVDKAGDLVSQSLLNMPLPEVTADTETLLDKTEAAGNIFSKFAVQVAGVTKGYIANTDQLKKSLELNHKLSEVSVALGVNLGDLKTTAGEVMKTFRMNLMGEDSVDNIKNISKEVTTFGRVLGIGTADALNFYSKRVRQMGGDTKGAARDLANIALVSSDLKKEYKGLTLNSKDLTDAVLRSVDADVRSSQNIRIKTEMIKKQIAASLKLGKTEAEALEQAEKATKILTNPDSVAAQEARLAMAKDFKVEYEKRRKIQSELDAAEKSGDREAIIAAQTKKNLYEAELDAKYQAGMSEKEAENEHKRRHKLYESMQKGLFKDQWSLSKVLAGSYGSQMVGMEAVFNKMKKTYKEIPADVLASEMGLDLTKDFDIVIRLQEAIKAGNMEMFTGALQDAGKLDETLTAVQKRSEEAGQTSIMKGILGPIKSFFVDNEIVSTVLGLGSGVAALAGFTKDPVEATNANTKALWMNTAAHSGLGKLFGKFSGKLGGLFKGGKGLLGKAFSGGKGLLGSVTGGMGKLASGGKGLLGKLGGAVGGKAFGALAKGGLKGIPLLGTLIGGGLAAKNVWDIGSGMISGKGVEGGDLARLATNLLTMVPVIGTGAAVGGAAAELTGAYDKLGTIGGPGKTAPLAAPDAMASSSSGVNASPQSVMFNPDGSIKVAFDFPANVMAHNNLRVAANYAP